MTEWPNRRRGEIREWLMSFWDLTPRGEKKDMQEIRVQKMMRGWKVTVGCQTLVYSHSEQAEMAMDFKEYTADPEAKTRQMTERFGNNALSHQRLGDPPVGRGELRHTREDGGPDLRTFSDPVEEQEP